MYILLIILSIVCTVGAMGSIFYTYYKEAKDASFGYKSSILARNVTIVLFALTFLFKSLADLIK